jgi:predicted transcriptional regulator
MPAASLPSLSRRERQIMDLLYKLGRATAREIHAGIADPPSYSSIRALLAVLENKGHLSHEQDGPRYLYIPTLSRTRARVMALKQVVDTFYEGSAAQAVSALIGPGNRMSESELDELAGQIAAAKKEGRKPR